MCNPRRVRVQATRKIAEAWRTEIKQAATARGDVSSEARMTQLISDYLPEPARRAFEQAMRSSPDWELTDGEYRREVPGGHVAYRPDTGELEIVVRLSVAIEAVGTAKLVAEGEVVDEVTAEGIGTYYADGFGGITEEHAKRQAEKAADAKLTELAEQRTASLKQKAEDKAKHELKKRQREATEQAKLSAEHKLTTQAQELQTGLDVRAGEQLEQVQAETLKGIFQLVAAGYSAALQEYAAQYGQNLQVSEEDGVIAIEFELER
ncbi:hypothetical protein [Actinocrispum wychmicini]|uniref:FtsH ternary system domain-containing protein n=1 Tax=Actinocrispum wychmicini TaxID=1213861 RepID=A0A4R2J8C2_9PSEU|nr:hypothetical protein [Actinocrispum wychmicini]TCO52886.1 hypothetical protein EV192_11180 [Actinocrispum wychmicini]